MPAGIWDHHPPWGICIDTGLCTEKCWKNTWVPEPSDGSRSGLIYHQIPSLIRGLWSFCFHSSGLCRVTGYGPQTGTLTRRHSKAPLDLLAIADTWALCTPCFRGQLDKKRSYLLRLPFLISERRSHLHNAERNTCEVQGIHWDATGYSFPKGVTVDGQVQQPQSEKGLSIRAWTSQEWAFGSSLQISYQLQRQQGEFGMCLEERGGTQTAAPTSCIDDWCTLFHSPQSSKFPSRTEANRWNREIEKWIFEGWTVATRATSLRACPPRIPAEPMLLPRGSQMSNNLFHSLGELFILD